MLLIFMLDVPWLLYRTWNLSLDFIDDGCVSAGEWNVGHSLNNEQ